MLSTSLPFRHRSTPIKRINMQTQQPPLIKPAPQPASDPAHGAAIIFLHGLDDDAMGWESMSISCPNSPLIHSLHFMQT